MSSQVNPALYVLGAKATAAAFTLQRSRPFRRAYGRRDVLCVKFVFDANDPERSITVEKKEAPAGSAHRTPYQLLQALYTRGSVRMTPQGLLNALRLTRRGGAAKEKRLWLLDYLTVDFLHPDRTYLRKDAPPTD